MLYPRRRRVVKTKRRRVLRKKTVVIPRPLASGRIYSFKRTCQLNPYVYYSGAWARQATNAVSSNNALILNAGIFKFTLSDLPNYGDFSNLYEQVRLTGVKLRFIPYCGTESGNGGTNLTYMDALALCVDKQALDQASANPTFTEIIENQDARIISTQKPFKMYIPYPTVSQPVDAATQITQRNLWLDTSRSATESIDHNGVKFCFQGTQPANQSCAFRVYATYYIKCKNPQ